MEMVPEMKVGFFTATHAASERTHMPAALPSCLAMRIWFFYHDTQAVQSSPTCRHATRFTHHVACENMIFYCDTQAVQKRLHLSVLDTIYPSRHSIQTVHVMIERLKKIK
jgi:hypothetical protein